MYRDDLIRAEMAARQITVEKLAEMTGVSDVTISRIRAGKPVKLTLLERVVKVLGLSLSQIFQEKPKREGAAV